LPGAILVLVGEPGASLVDRPAAPIEPSESLVVRGWTTEVRTYLAAADIYVHPTHGDGMSNALLEAMASGLAIIATRIGSTADLLVHECNALLVDPGSPDQLADAIRRLTADPELRSRLSAGAVEASQRFELRAVVERIEGVYRRILQPSEEP
jgi:glycosyltransferase involved in cell wall biosynthesis